MVGKLTCACITAKMHLGLMQRLAHIINQHLHTIINMYQHQAHRMGSHLGSGHNRWSRKVFLQLLEGLDILLVPFESLPLVQQLEEMPTLVY